MEDYKKTFKDFWKDLVTNDDGSLNVDQIMRELHDYSRVMDNVSKVYMHITNRSMSKPNYCSEDVIMEFESVQEQNWEKFLKEEIEYRQTEFEDLNQDYLDLEKKMLKANGWVPEKGDKVRFWFDDEKYEGIVTFIERAGGPGDEEFAMIDFVNEEGGEDGCVVSFSAIIEILE